MQLEQEGLIYPVKGTGNFIADSEEVRKLSKASYIKELKTLIRKGKAMGMEAEELIYIIRAVSYTHLFVFLFSAFLFAGEAAVTLFSFLFSFGLLSEPAA